MSDETKPRGGSKKGRRFNIVECDPGDRLAMRYFRLSDKHNRALLRLGAGDATAGLRKLIEAALLLEKA